jgi:uncharacterized RDD family membrane protein YckC
MQSKLKKALHTQIHTSSSNSILHEKTGLVYGGFWVRFCAKMLDWIICSLLIAVLPLSNWDHSGVTIVSSHSSLLSVFLIKWFVPALYTTFFLVNYQATPGKMAFSLKVIPANHNKITYGIALARFFSELISAFLLFFGYIIAIFDIQKRTLHDRICQTFVVQTTQVVYHHPDQVDFTEAPQSLHQEPDIQNKNIYGLHTMLFSAMILESLFSAAYCLMEDPLFRMVTWTLNLLIGIFLMIAIFKQRYPNFSSSIQRLTWGICLYYCVILPIVYVFIFLIGIEKFLRNVPFVMDDPIVFLMQLIFSITNYVELYAWPQIFATIIFIPCTLILGLWGIILVSTTKLEQE